MDNKVHFGEGFTAGEELVDKFKFACNSMMKVFAEEFDFRMINGVLNEFAGEYITGSWWHEM